jgi:acetyl-CoA decarbonylase/synthase complex subunit delta
MQPPIVADVGVYVWKAKETTAPEADVEGWGALEERGIAWESISATAMLMAGSNLLIMRHPKAVEAAEKTIAELS